jgi:molybdopterin-guanine dinucleotide biosynthesis protein A
MLSVVVQAGGESRRMGQDKALLPFLGQPLIQRVIERVTGIADELLVTTNDPARYSFLGVPLYEDILPGRGALGGLYTALSVARSPLVAVVACDMPFVNAGLLVLGGDLLKHDDFDAVIPRMKKGTEPFHAVYRRETCLVAVKKALDEGKWRVDAWFSAVRIRYLYFDEVKAIDPEGLAFLNVNTLDELKSVEQKARA